MEIAVNVPEKNPRRFLPDNLKIQAWEQLQPFFDDLLERNFETVPDLENWLNDRSELEAVLEEDLAWRYIKMNIDTSDKALNESFNTFITEIQPKIAPYHHKLNEKLVNSPLINQLDHEKYFIHLRSVKKEIEIFREENIPIFTELQKEEQTYGAICAAMTVEMDGQEVTLPKAASYLKDPDRSKREEAFRKIYGRRLQEKEKFDELFNKLISLRTQVAKNAGFENYRDFKFAELGRFDYTVKNCFDFHDSMEHAVIPVIEKTDLEKRKKLGVTEMYPWDADVDGEGKQALKPFESGGELLEKTIKCFYRIRPFFGECLYIMKQMGYLDLESKKGKAPGGFNYPLYEIGVPFIYMNAVGTFRDLTTMVHEGGHAIHSFLNRDLELTAFKNIPSEVAELASMSMELISMDHWDVFFNNEDDLKRAKKEQLEKVLDALPWIAVIDKFQHWIYENPEHTSEERSRKWLEFHQSLSSKIIHWEGLETERTNLWQKQLHLFEVPFYYIEYGFAQLGAIAIWRNYKRNPEQALDQFTEALALGYTKPIGEIYRTAGIKFDFSLEYVQELVNFIRNEMESV